MDFELDRGIALDRLGGGQYSVQLDPGWLVGAGLNGGYLLAAIGNAIKTELSELGHVDPISISAYYLSPTVPGPAYVRVRRVRLGRQRSTVAATLVQQQEEQEVERITTLAVFGLLDETTNEVQRQLSPPVLPPVEECVPTSQGPAEFLAMAPLVSRLGIRLDPASIGWAVGEPSGTGSLQGWFKLADDRPLDPLALLLAVDALPPVTFDLGLPGWAPTLELTAHLRARPAEGWAILRHGSRNISGGMFEEDCEVWDSTGRLVAQSRQLALLPRPR